MIEQAVVETRAATALEREAMCEAFRSLGVVEALKLLRPTAQRDAIAAIVGVPMPVELLGFIVSTLGAAGFEPAESESQEPPGCDDEDEGAEGPESEDESEEEPASERAPVVLSDTVDPTTNERARVLTGWVERARPKRAESIDPTTNEPIQREGLGSWPQR